jgi:toxin ParE1/3/4
MAEWRLSEEAIQDLREIAVFTGENWGVAQSDGYLEVFYAAIYRIAEFPDIGAPREALMPGMRMFPARRHRLYYTSDTGEVTIVRVLHGAQSEDEEFAPPP